MMNIEILTTEDLKHCILDACEELTYIYKRKACNESYDDDEELRNEIEAWLEIARNELTKRIC